MQHSCSHYTAICDQRINKRIELTTHTWQPLVAEHSAGTDYAPNRAQPYTRRTHEVPLRFIAGRRHCHSKNPSFPAAAFPPTQVPCNIHAAITLRSATRGSTNAKNYAHMNCRTPWRKRLRSESSAAAPAAHTRRRPKALYTEKDKVSCCCFPLAKHIRTTRHGVRNCSSKTDLSTPEPKEEDDLNFFQPIKKSPTPKLRKYADKSLSQRWCSHSNTIYDVQLQKTKVFRTQPWRQATLMQPLHCDLWPESQQTQRTTHTWATTRCRTPWRNHAPNRAQPHLPHTRGDLWSWGCLIMIRWSADPLIRWSADPLVRWSADPLIRWSAGPLIRWSADPLIRWSADPLIRWSADPLIRWSADPLVRWSADPLIRWSADPLVRWSADPLIRWSADPLIRWSADPLIRWSADPLIRLSAGQRRAVSPCCRPWPREKRNPNHKGSMQQERLWTPFLANPSGKAFYPILCDQDAHEEGGLDGEEVPGQGYMGTQKAGRRTAWNKQSLR